MKEYKNIDELFRDGLKNFEATPSPAVWQNIEKGIMPSAGSSSLISGTVKWISALMVTIFTGLAIFYFAEKNPETVIGLQTLKNENINKKTSGSGLPVAKKTTDASKQTSDQSANNYNSKTIEIQTSGILTEKQKNIDTRNVNSQLKNNVTANTSNTYHTPENIDKNISTTNKTSATYGYPLTKKSTVYKTDINNSAKQAPAKVIHGNTKISAGKLNVLRRNQNAGFTTKPTLKQINTYASYDSGAEKPQTIKSDNNNHVKNLKSKNITIDNGELTALFPEDKTVIHNAKQIARFKKRIHSYTGFSASSGVICYKNSGEKQLTWSVDGIAGMNFKKFYLETGIGYRYMRQTGNYRIDFRTYDSIGYYNEVTSYEVDPNDENNIILHYKEITVFDSIHHVAFTSPEFNYRYLTIPLKAGYSFWNKKRMFMALESGIEYSYLVSSVVPGTGFDQQGDITQIINQTESRSSNIWKINIDLRFGYRLNNNILLLFQPGYGKYVTSVYDTKKGFPEEKPCLVNFKGALLFDF